MEDGQSPLPFETDGFPILDIPEKGGRGTTDRYAQVVCGLSGRAIKPFFIPRSNIPIMGVHARFSMPETATVIRVENDEARLTRYVMKRDGMKVMLERIVMWQGSGENLPPQVESYQNAVDAAFEKAECNMCVHAHYADMGAESWTHSVELTTPTSNIIPEQASPEAPILPMMYNPPHVWEKTQISRLITARAARRIWGDWHVLWEDAVGDKAAFLAHRPADGKSTYCYAELPSKESETLDEILIQRMMSKAVFFQATDELKHWSTGQGVKGRFIMASVLAHTNQL